MAKPFYRLIWLLQVFQSKRFISKDELDRKWCGASLNERRESRIPIRTLQNHIKDIYVLFGVKIRFSRSEQAYYLDDSETDTNELAMMQDLIINNMVRGNDSLRDRVHIGSNGFYNKSVAVIMEAISEGKAIMIESTKIFTEDEKEYLQKKYNLNPSMFDDWITITTEFRPFFLDFVFDQWYVLGYCPERKRYEVHKVSGRIEKTNNSFDLDKNTNLQDFRKAHFLKVKGSDIDLYDDRIEYSSELLSYSDLDVSDDEYDEIVDIQIQ